MPTLQSVSSVPYHRRANKAENRKCLRRIYSKQNKGKGRRQVCRINRPPLPALWVNSTLVSFTGDVYELTVEDAREVVRSEQIAGKIWLTDTYGGNTHSFITIPIRDEMTRELIIQRQRVM